MSGNFETLSLTKELIETLKELKFNSMTPIQEKSLPVVLEGKDVIAQAKTGSGKTAAFGLGILNSLDISKLEPQALVLCPTRELAEQVAKELRMLARQMQNVRILTLCGGVIEMHQRKSLAHGVHIIVGTPGRVLKLLSKDVFSLQPNSIFTLDEADRMLDMGFYDDLMNIASYLPKKRQTLLFSATFPEEIKALGKSVQSNAVDIKTDIDHAPNIINQKFYEVSANQDKNNALWKILCNFKPERLIVFCRTKQATGEVAQFLSQRGIVAACINGDLQQSERTSVLTQFSNRSLTALIATDVAARGLDIQELEAVVNYDLPIDAEVYVHRIGRTGRAGKHGNAFTLIGKNEKHKIQEIEDYTHESCNVESINVLKSATKYDLLPPMKTMYIRGGKKDKLRPSDVLGALVGEAKIDPKHVGDISIKNVMTYVAIHRSSIEQAIDKLREGRVKKRKFRVGLVEG